MRRFSLFFLLLIGLSGGIASSGTATPMAYAYSCDLSPQVLDYILKKAAKELGMTYELVVAKYKDGSCIVQQQSPKTYKVSTGGGSIIILDDTL